MLVIGGTPQGITSNRMREDACNLKPCLNKTFNVEFQDAINSEDLDQIYEVLEQFEQAGINIVGSRGYVYHSGKLKEILKCASEGAFMNLSIFPRTNGLRNAVEISLSKGVNKCL